MLIQYNFVLKACYFKENFYGMGIYLYVHSCMSPKLATNSNVYTILLTVNINIVSKPWAQSALPRSSLRGSQYWNRNLLVHYRDVLCCCDRARSTQQFNLKPAPLDLWSSNKAGMGHILTSEGMLRCRSNKTTPLWEHMCITRNFLKSPG